MAALRNQIGTVLIPRDNVRDLEEIDQTVRAALRFIPVETVDQVLPPPCARSGRSSGKRWRTPLPPLPR